MVWYASDSCLCGSVDDNQAFDIRLAGAEGVMYRLTQLVVISNQ